MMRLIPALLRRSEPHFVCRAAKVEEHRHMHRRNYVENYKTSSFEDGAFLQYVLLQLLTLVNILI